MFPQRWAFFTKGNTGYSELFIINDKRLQKLDVSRTASFSYYGLGKQAKIIRDYFSAYRKKRELFQVENAQALVHFIDTAKRTEAGLLSMVPSLRSHDIVLIVQPPSYIKRSDINYPLQAAVFSVPNAD
jgi:hypothetical protein